MKKIALIIGSLILLGAMLLLLGFWTRPDKPAKQKISGASPEPVLASASVPVVEQQYAWQGTYAQLPAAGGTYDPSLPQWQEWRRRTKDDNKWEWKTPIAFYGRVLDQENNAIPGVAGVIAGDRDQNVNLKQPPFNFDREHKYHSGQFRGMNVERRHYWEKLLIDCGLKEAQ